MQWHSICDCLRAQSPFNSHMKDIAFSYDRQLPSWCMAAPDDNKDAHMTNQAHHCDACLPVQVKALNTTAAHFRLAYTVYL